MSTRINANPGWRDRAKGNYGIPQFDPAYPKYKSIELCPDIFDGWIVTLTTGRYRVGLGTLKEWLNKYAR